MIWNDHSKLRGQHAFLSASKYHWINYDINKLSETWINYQAVQRGTELHDIAAKLIKHNIRQRKCKQTFNMYVNDAIGFQMTPEQILYYSENCFGTADTISFKKDILRIHDLKTGSTPAHMEQLFVYNALFCLEYGVRPNEIKTELRIYQNNEIDICEPDPDRIFEIMDKIQEFDEFLSSFNNEVLYDA